MQSVVSRSGGVGALALLLLGMGASAAHAAPGIPWEKTYAAAVARAKKTNRLVMVDLYTNW